MYICVLFIVVEDGMGGRVGCRIRGITEMTWITFCAHLMHFFLEIFEFQFSKSISSFGECMGCVAIVFELVGVLQSFSEFVHTCVIFGEIELGVAAFR